METKLPSTGTSRNTLAVTRPLRYRFQARSHLGACIRNTSFAFGNRLYSRAYFLHISYVSLLNKSKEIVEHAIVRWCYVMLSLISQLKLLRRLAWPTRSSVDGGGLNPSPKNNTRNRTRLIRAAQAIRLKLRARIKETQKNFLKKVLFFLVGFYCATAFATVIGQTGDWDILSAALSVAVVEGIGALTYRTSRYLLRNVRSLITMFNYWKAGLSLGLFLDSFKYKMDYAIGLSNLFKFEIDVLPAFW